MRVLNAGCGNEPLPKYFENIGGEWEETRLDLEPANEPDIVGSITDLGNIGPFDAVSCSHTLEHLYPHEVPRALKEFYRVLKPGGFVIILVPDLEGISATEDPLYEAPGQVVTGLDLIYGLRHCTEHLPYMAHHTGFVSDTLRTALAGAGFERIEVKRMMVFNLLGVAIK